MGTWIGTWRDGKREAVLGWAWLCGESCGKSRKLLLRLPEF